MIEPVYVINVKIVTYSFKIASTLLRFFRRFFWRFSIFQRRRWLHSCSGFMKMKFIYSRLHNDTKKPAGLIYSLCLDKVLFNKNFKKNCINGLIHIFIRYTEYTEYIRTNLASTDLVSYYVLAQWSIKFFYF